MKKIRFKQHKAGYGGWSEWVFPTPKTNYLFKCCDCGLVHEIQFKTFMEGNKRKNGYFEVIELPKEIRSMFKVRRNK